MAYWNPNLISMLYYHTGWIAVLIIGIALILRFRRRNKPFDLIPGPKGHFLLGNTLDFSISTDHHALLLKWARKYGSVFKYYILFGGYRVHITDPEIAKHVIVKNCKNYRRQDVLKKVLPGFGNGLITANGRAHAIQRKQLNPFFTKARVQQFLPIFVGKTNELLEFWTNEISKTADKTMDCDVLEKLTHLTLDVIGLCAFGYSFNCIKGGHNEESKATDTILRASFDLQKRSLKQLFPIMKLVKSNEEKEFQKAEKCFRSLIDKIVRQRRKGERLKTDKSKNEQDLLEMMFEMEDENHNKITDEDIYHQVFTFMIAGHETTSLTATWTLLLLAKHIDIQEKVREEINNVLGFCNDRELAWQDLDSMKYLDKCIKEAMRLYPVAITTDRTSINADKLGKYEIPPGTHVMVGIGSLHRLGSYWKDPDEFNPDRFDEKDETSRSLQYHFLPFSRGPRMCIGYRFALAELKVTLAKILQTFTFSFSADKNPDLRSISTLTLKPFPPPVLQISLAEKY